MEEEEEEENVEVVVEENWGCGGGGALGLAWRVRVGGEVAPAAVAAAVAVAPLTPSPSPTAEENTARYSSTRLCRAKSMGSTGTLAPEEDRAMPQGSGEAKGMPVVFRVSRVALILLPDAMAALLA